ncbi:MAG: hypothetical protein A2158_03195 [Chloroflexi bacterium RBG_13_46_14]|nr:MAG: hypothetical protein A2158_03195 [Chloroflexi bacterium RBG_13_46_14]
MMMTSFYPLRGILYLSAAGFAWMAAATLALYYLDHIITDNQIQLPVKWHRYGHICENILND